MYGNKLIAFDHYYADSFHTLVEIDYLSAPNYNPDVTESQKYFYIKSQIDTQHILVHKRIDRS